MNRIKIFKSDYLILFSLWVLGLIMDSIWISNHNIPPAWDQSFHLTNLYKMSYILREFQLFSFNWWYQILSVTDNYRGPLTYLISSPFFLTFGSTYKAAILSNCLFNAILLFSTYYLGRIIYSREAGLWSAFICSFSPALVVQRTDFLIDFSLTSILTCTWLCFSYWYFRKHKLNVAFSILTGLLLGCTALVRPTGIIFLILPIIITLFKAFFSFFNRNFIPLINSFIVFISFIFIFSPWFSINWLTILTSLNRARQWGISYQEGLEANTLEGLLFYPLLLPKMIGVCFITSIIILLIFSFKRRSNNVIFNKFSSQHSIWFISFPLGGLLICTLMTTKDYRFILPLLPQFAIALGIIISSNYSKRVFNKFSKVFLVLILFFTIIWNQFGFGFNLSAFPVNKPNSQDKWPIEDIIKTIVTESPNVSSTLAVLPDSKYLNAFNLEAEGQRQLGQVSARQIVSNLENVDDDLYNYDWFLIKTGEQGVMSNNRQAKLTNLLLDSSAFVVIRTWTLPDKSEAFLLHRQPLSLTVSPINCSDTFPKAIIKPLPSGLDISILGKISNIQDKRLLIDLVTSSEKITYDHMIGQGMLYLRTVDPEACINVSERYRLQAPQSLLNLPVKTNIRLISSDGHIDNINTDNTFYFNNKLDKVLLNNRVNLLLEMGQMLRNGSLDDLFDKVGQVNQSDPNQLYLSNSEAILIQRFEENPNNIDYLYSLALAQALKKKATDAYQTLDYLTNIDSENEYAFLARAVVELYIFNPRKALESIEQVNQLTANKSLLEINHTLKIISHIMLLDFFKLFSFIE
ncbi:tetratricopeptide repeat protein [Prochlorococcus marinus]|uniref:tetratricopeptide repeat protein n=1 Tax=Prochlorococcus marinus TaxID=1219 RepID=UPI000566BBEF|nr:glycosyltransferase family 39 protein [Prochlorococcus marinus]